MIYEIFFLKTAKRFLEKLDKNTQIQIVNEVDKLAFNPRPFGYKKLVGGDGFYRIKIKQYRIIYTIEDNLLIVSIVRIAKRDESTY